MSWTTFSDIKAQIQKLWDKGRILSSLAGGENLFPLRLTLKGPSSSDLSERFDEVRSWIEKLRKEEGKFRIVYREVRHRIIGANSVPAEIWIDHMESAISIIGKKKECVRFCAIVELVAGTHPELMEWIRKRPLNALELCEVIPLLLDVVSWTRNNPRPGIYLRQIDIPGIHTKFIESHRAVLSELLDMALPPGIIDPDAKGVTNFCKRYGFRDKPHRIRFRILDPAKTILEKGRCLNNASHDITINHEVFADLNMDASEIYKIFITENEINFLSFPEMPDTMVIFGAGYGFDRLAEAKWLNNAEIFYWGDTDTHGFAILDQFRSFFPHAKSFLMDKETFLFHRDHWSTEPQPEKRDLKRLNNEEAELYDDLRTARFGLNLRLEQERIGFGWMENALRKLMQKQNKTG